ncbi:hypothetical protein AAJ76_2880001045 [Vairimorpha ceranae]|uniref:Integrase catalytic domain-containing protein n=1 Tax=Vairimorpha ceranae TaxID=40302 RepID=A0A0F9W9N8_9MICR|nr:hypothetical protein AAJ76_2880001045 [Vairimorpha ceranae]KAF5139699.1 hypothetical protein G9O61_00g021430 [Vairimorpha ceranae]KKO73705.1 hypothetical protein AAJ76_2880001045 [Vairimorpha ceranae]
MEPDLETKRLRDGFKKTILKPPYASYANGISEVINKIITEVIKINQGKNITKIIKLVTFRLNENTNRGLWVAPNSILRGYNFFDLDQNPITHHIKANNATTVNK